MARAQRSEAQAKIAKPQTRTKTAPQTSEAKGNITKGDKGVKGTKGDKGVKGTKGDKGLKAGGLVAGEEWILDKLS